MKIKIDREVLMNSTVKRALIGASILIIIVAVVMITISLIHRSRNHDDD